MSAIIYDLDERKGGFVAVDTLATMPGYYPWYFTSKAFAIPHLRMVVAVTGIANVLEPYIAAINRRPIKGISDLSTQCSEILQEVWMDHVEARFELEGVPGEGNNSTTVWHFGFSELTGNCTIFTNYVGDEFATEIRPCGIFGKPAAGPFKPSPNKQVNLQRIMLAQQSIEHEKPFDKRLHIGGEMVMFNLTKDGILITTAARFPDYGDIHEEIFG